MITISIDPRSLPEDARVTVQTGKDATIIDLLAAEMILTTELTCQRLFEIKMPGYGVFGVGVSPDPEGKRIFDSNIDNDE